MAEGRVETGRNLPIVFDWRLHRAGIADANLIFRQGACRRLPPSLQERRLAQADCMAMLLQGGILIRPPMGDPLRTMPFLMPEVVDQALAAKGRVLPDVPLTININGVYLSEISFLSVVDFALSEAGELVEKLPSRLDPAVSRGFKGVIVGLDAISRKCTVTAELEGGPLSTIYQLDQAQIRLQAHIQLRQRLDVAVDLEEIEHTFAEVLLRNLGATAVKVYKVDDERTVTPDVKYVVLSRGEVAELRGDSFYSHFAGGLKPADYAGEIMGTILSPEHRSKVLVVHNPKVDVRCYRDGSFLNTGPFISIREEVNGKLKRVYMVEYEDARNLLGERSVADFVELIHEEVLMAKAALIRKRIDGIIAEICEAVKGVRTLRQAFTAVVLNLPRIFQEEGRIVDRVSLILPDRSSGNLVVREEWINPELDPAAPEGERRKNKAIPLKSRKSSGMPISWLIYSQGISVRHVAEEGFSGQAGINWRRGGRGSILGVPIKGKGRRPIGVLIVSSLSRNAFTSQHLETLESICEFLGIAFLEAHKLENRLFLDDKFGVAYTPRYFAETLLPDAVRMSGETRRPLAGMFFDLDFFGKPNKVFGNDTIDKYVFGPFIRMIGRSLRQGTFFARHGGDEFSILFPDDNGDGAVATSERLRKLLEKRIFKLSKELGTDENAAQTEYRAILAGIDEHGAGQIIQDVRFGKNGDQYVVTATIRFTMSSGVAVYRSGNAAGEIGEGPDNFLSRMNTAYLAAKRLGRNQTYFIGQRLVASSPIAK